MVTKNNTNSFWTFPVELCLDALKLTPLQLILTILSGGGSAGGTVNRVTQPLHWSSLNTEVRINVYYR